MLINKNLKIKAIISLVVVLFITTLSGTTMASDYIMSSYTKIEGDAGTVITDLDFCIKNTIYTNYTLVNCKDKMQITKEGLKLLKPSEGTVTFEVNGKQIKLPYHIKGEIVEEEKQPPTKPVVEEGTINIEPTSELTVTVQTLDNSASSNLKVCVDTLDNLVTLREGKVSVRDFNDNQTHTLFLIKSRDSKAYAYKVGEFKITSNNLVLLSKSQLNSTLPTDEEVRITKATRTYLIKSNENTLY